MEDSKIEWLGEIPAHWEVKKLKYLAKSIGGGTPSKGNPEYWNGDIPWVSPKDMKVQLIDTTEDYVTELGAIESATNIIQPNAVLIVVRSGILKHSIPVAINTVPVTINQDMKALVAGNKVLPEYLHLLIHSNQAQLLPFWSKQGCTVESIESEYMMNSRIPVPPLSEQNEIVTYINRELQPIVKVIKRCEEAILTLKEYRSALITNAVTGKIDVREYQAEALPA